MRPRGPPARPRSAGSPAPAVRAVTGLCYNLREVVNAMFWFWDPTMIIVLPAILLALYAQLRVRSTYARYSQVPVSTGLTGAAAAQEILRRNGLANVQIERIDGMLSDHYDP